ncbi:restriction endonuclease subunit S [Francisella tularensis]|uniref:restriction endonuclease subunit S n=1 Tax=Francisella tularensis TaxID=263 RepID=UPI001C0F0A1F|nr:restriction endonuclease subunit S [Francisella tularensis]MBK2110554.1 restriction endonuclease subunit S [Francisella tularensis subsp. novicida FSC595]
MNKDAESKKVPKLRFKEFSGEWQYKRLNNIFKEIFEKVGSRDIQTYSITAGKGFISQSEKFGKDISGNQNEKYIVVYPGEFSYNKGNSKKYKYGCIYPNILNKPIAVPNVFISFRLINDGMSVTFFAKMFENHCLDRGLRGIISSSARMDGLLNVSKDSFFKLKINLPTLPEQQKIADCLSTWDEVIETQKSLIEAKKLFKKGMMQKIFSQELRFKADDGGDFPEWVEKKLSQIFNVTAGQSKSKYIDKDGNNIIVDMGGISSEPKLIAKKYTFFKNDYLTTKDLVMPKDDIGGGLIIGKVVAIPENNKYICGDHIYKLTNKEGNIIFMQYVINSYAINKSFRQKANGTAQIGLNKKEVDNQKIPFPCLAEQTKIANFLSAIDEEIELLEQELEQLQLQKKGLMQGMFV